MDLGDEQIRDGLGGAAQPFSFSSGVTREANVTCAVAAEHAHEHDAEVYLLCWSVGIP